MATIIRMPEVLANAVEAVLSTWEAPEGATLAVGDLIAEIETEKAVVELAAEEAGVLARRLVAAGDTVAVGAPVALLLTSADEPYDLEALLGADGLAAGRSTQMGAPAVDEAVAGHQEPAAGPDGALTPRRFASPLARKLAKDSGLDLAALVGSGPGGRIVRRDVDRAIASRADAAAGGPTTPSASHASSAPSPTLARAGAPERPAAAGRPAGPVGGGSVVPHSPMRRAIARRLTESKASVPHFYVTAECRVDALLALRAEINADGSTRISLNDLLLKAVAAAFRAVPEANVQWSDEGTVRLDHVDVAVAVATDGGLLTPVVRDVERLTLGAVSQAVADLVTRARAGRLRQEELEGGSTTVSNLGMYGTREFTAILNPPQATILAVGAAVAQPVVVDGELAVGTVMRCTLSADHRVIDGALAARWLRAFQETVEHPVRSLV